MVEQELLDKWEQACSAYEQASWYSLRPNSGGHVDPLEKNRLAKELSALVDQARAMGYENMNKLKEAVG